MKLGFFVGQLGCRGTDQFVWKLADVAETLLGHQSVIVTHQNQPATQDVTNESKAMFHSRFFVVPLMPTECLDDIAERYGFHAMYISSWGVPDGLITTKIPCVVHAIFQCSTPYGHVYASISEHMRRKCQGKCEVLPFCVDLLPKHQDLRETLGIPADAFVFGRHGGFDTFDISFVHEAVRSVNDSNVYFLFLNTRQFMPSSSRIIFLPGTPDLQYRSDFVHACDAMIHGRSDGETFGLACAEFSMANKPVLTTDCGDLAHVNILSPNVWVSRNAAEYVQAMTDVRTAPLARFDAYRQFTPAAVARKFQELVDKSTGPFYQTKQKRP